MMEMLPWTEERKAEFREYYAAGLSHSDIAMRLGGTTKNACVGIAHRLGLPPRRPANRRMKIPATAPPLPPVKLVKPAKPAPAPPVQPKPAVVGKKGLIIWDLNHTHCRWPLAGEGVAMRYCAQPKDEGSSYCQPHRELSMAPSRRASGGHMR